MGCGSNDRIRQSFIQPPCQKNFYNLLDRHGGTRIFRTQYSIFQAQGHAFLLFWKESLLNIVDPQTCDKYEFLLQGVIKNVACYQKYIIILTNMSLYRLQMVDDRMKIVKQMRFRLGNEKQKISILFISMDFLLLQQKPYVYIIKLGVLSIFKIIFKLYIDIGCDDFMHYDDKYGAIIYRHFDYLNILDVKSKLCRQVKLRCPYYSDQIRLKYVKIVENIIDVLLLSDQGLFLNKINYQEANIQTVRFLYSQLKSCDICEENNQLTLYTTHMFLILDKDYNIKQKFELNHQDVYQKRDFLTDISMRISCKSYLFLIQECTFNIESQEERYIRICKQNQKINTGTIWIREIKDYRVENAFKAEISLNQLYLANLKEQTLLFYIIESKIEMQYFFKEALRYLKFSCDSHQLCILSHKRIIYFKCQSGLKQKFQLFCKINKKIINGRNGIDVCIDQNDKIRVVSQTAKKLIFTLKKFYNGGYQVKLNYCGFSGIIMISEQFDELAIIYQLQDRKQIRLNIEKSNWELVQNAKLLMIISLHGQLESWSLNTQCAIQSKQIIRQDVCNFIKGSSKAFYFVGYNHKVLGLDHNLKLKEEILFDHLEFSPIQVMDNYVLCQTLNGMQLTRRTLRY